MPSFDCGSSLETQVLLCNICPYRLLVQVFRGTFQQAGLVFICFSCLRDILRSRAEANAACYRLFLQTCTTGLPDVLQRKGPNVFTNWSKLGPNLQFF